MKSQSGLADSLSTVLPVRTWGRIVQVYKMNKDADSKILAAQFCDLAKPFRLKLYNYIHKSLNFSEEADDVYQETLLHAFKYFKAYKKDKPFNAWLFAIGHNEIRRHMRNIYPSIQMNPAKQPFTSDIGFKSLLIKEVYSYAEQLRPKHREVFFLYYDSGFNTTEICHITGLSKGYVRLILYKARKFLKLKLGESHEKKA
jgi:RNA polymerase sigma-70 factor (ECF subfamily)